MNSKDGEGHLSRTELRNKRLDDLLQSCQEQMLAQVVGPFGLTPAMFDDKDGGNVTTLHNFEQGITATDKDQESYQEFKQALQPNSDRRDYDKLKDTERRRLIGDKNIETVTSAYTSNEIKADRNAHLDHVTAVNSIEENPEAHLFMDRKQRVKMASQEANLQVSEGSINQSMQDKDKFEWVDSERKADKGKTNGESFGIDREAFDNTVNNSKSAIKQDLLVAQIKKQGAELAVTSAKEAGKNAIRQALGILLHELITGVISELKLLFKRKIIDNLIDEVSQAFKRVFTCVKGKANAALDAAKAGGISAILSNILTFLINKLITTSAKLVTVIREGITGFVRAVKFMLNPPADMEPMEVARETSKLIAAVLMTSAGILLEESLGAALLSIAPILAPIIDIVSPALTALLTGLGSALVIYSLDRFFDWLSSSNTDLLVAYEENLQAMSFNMEKMASWIQSQYQNSNNYQQLNQGYSLISLDLMVAEEYQEESLELGVSVVSSNDRLIENISGEIDNLKSQAKKLDDLLNNYEYGD